MQFLAVRTPREAVEREVVGADTHMHSHSHTHAHTHSRTYSVTHTSLSHSLTIIRINPLVQKLKDALLKGYSFAEDALTRYMQCLAVRTPREAVEREVVLPPLRVHYAPLDPAPHEWQHIYEVCAPLLCFLSFFIFLSLHFPLYFPPKFYRCPVSPGGFNH